MSAITQTILHSDPSRPGNCFAACVATALNLTLDEVPHFVEWGQWVATGERKVNLDSDTADRSHWWAMFLGFCWGRGVTPELVDSVNDAEPGEVVFVGGRSPRGVPHQVLYRDGVLWHDPHPSRAGLESIDGELWVLRQSGRHDHDPTTPLPEAGEGR